MDGTLGQAALPELAALRRTLLGWLGTARDPGLDEDGMVALFTSALRDSPERGGQPGEGAGRRASRGRRGPGVEHAEGFA